MSVQFIEPVERAWQGMVRILFQPFKLEKWIVIGFAAWLAGLASGGHGGFGWNLGGGNGGNGGRNAAVEADGGRALAELSAAPEMRLAVEGPRPYGTAVEHPHPFRPMVEAFGEVGPWGPFLVGCMVVFGVFVLALLVLLLWLSSRGAFIFLDNVVLDSPEIVRPWKEYARRGNSLFVWRLGFVAVLLAGIAAAGWVIYLMIANSTPWLAIPIVCALVVWVLGAVVVDVLLRHFVVPVMYKHDLRATAAWGRFLTLLKAQLLPFGGFLLMLMLLWIVVGVGIVVAGFLTCCIGFLLLAIPYVGTVLLLPVLVFFRLLSLEFLRQFGPEGDLLTPPAEAPAV